MLKLFSAVVAVSNLLTGFLLACFLQNLQSSQKQSAAQHCNCTIADVENALAKFTWAKEAHKKIEKLKQEGKPMPKNLAEVLHALVCFDSQMRFTHNTRKLLCAYIYGRHGTLLQTICVISTFPSFSQLHPKFYFCSVGPKTDGIDAFGSCEI